MKFLIINGSLTPPEKSNTQQVINQVREEFARKGVETNEVVLRDLRFQPGIDWC
jgi:multimeric flavodoxin WrbA